MCPYPQKASKQANKLKINEMPRVFIKSNIVNKKIYQLYKLQSTLKPRNIYSNQIFSTFGCNMEQRASHTTLTHKVLTDAQILFSWIICILKDI